MNTTSPFITGGATITVATLEPLVRWGLTGFAHPIPDAVPGVVAALLFTAGHAALNWFAARGIKSPQ